MGSAPDPTARAYATAPRSTARNPPIAAMPSRIRRRSSGTPPTSGVVRRRRCQAECTHQARTGLGGAESSWWPPRRTPTARSRHRSLLPSPMSSTQGSRAACVAGRPDGRGRPHTPEDQPLRGGGGKGGAMPLARRDTGQPYRQVQNLFLGRLRPASSAPRRTRCSHVTIAAGLSNCPTSESSAPCSVAPLPRAMARS